MRDFLKHFTVPGRPIALYLGILFFFLAFNVLLVFLPFDMRVGSILTQIVVILGGALLYRRYFAHPDIKWPSLRSLGMSPWALLMVLLCSLALGLMSNAVVALQLELFPGLKEMAMQYQELVEDLLLPESIGAQIVGAVAVTIVAPICEEVLFRGTILPEQRRGQLAAGAIILNGLLFSLMHLSNPVGFLALAVVGSYFAHVTLRSNALWGAILGHAALNLLNGVILIRVAQQYGLDGVEAVEEVEFVELLILSGVLIAGVAILWWLSIRLIKKSNPHRTSSPPEDSVVG